MRPRSDAPVVTGRNSARASATASTPCRPARSRTSADTGTTTPASTPVTIATSASWSIAKLAGVVSNATFTSSSRAAASAWRAIRATLPGTVSPVRNRMLAAWPMRTRPTTDSSMRVATHSVDGSTMRRTGLPATTVVPTSACRNTTMPSSGEAIRVNERTVSE